MYCRNCGKEIRDDAATCIHCGANIKPVAARTENNTLAIVGFILSFFVTVAGLICSIIGYKRACETESLDGKGLALAGIIISALKILGEIVAIIIYIGVFLAIINIPGGM